ncbi:hypothetical protein MINTMi27_15760 [Mycobacterium intracellulare]|nr:hypothetical protein [Mycobacterium intracellulare]BCP41483.1 hypothetical protein MINTMi27_15760 [Mycobacterium intracellulare]
MSSLFLGHPYDYMVWACTAAFVALAVWDAGYLHKGRHRGKYVEKPEWLPQPEEFFLWGGHVKIVDFIDAPSMAQVTITPIVNEGDHGRFGDLDIDRADAPPLCPFLPDGCLGDIGEEWVEIGTLD